MTADEWLARAIVRMILADNVLNRMEYKSLRSSIQRLGLDIDIDAIFDLLNQKKAVTLEEFQLEPFTSIPLELKMKMLISLVRIAAIDKEVVSQEATFFHKATALLGLNIQVAHKLLDWADSLVELNRKEEELYEFAGLYKENR